MESCIEKDCSLLGGMFQQIIADLRNGTPLWEDLISKATKLQTCLKATIQAIASYLDAFQKIADAATNTRGATKEIGTALTRICLRHRAVEAKMKTFTSAIMECLVAPLQEKLEDWKKSVINLDKEHAKECKKARADLKKRSTDTLRLQKKARKGGKSDELQKAMQEITEKKSILEETEKKAVRDVLIEERSRYCLFVTFLKPVVDEEIAMLSELSHLQEAMDQLEKHTSEPYALPAASEQVIIDLKGADASWAFQNPPPSSPSSLGSRKSSMCSISSLNSSSSGSTKSHHSPNHMFWNRSSSQRYRPSPLVGNHRISSISSQDSGFTSQDTLCIRNSTASFFQQQMTDMLEENIGSSTESATSLAAPTATWPNLQDTLQFEKAASAIMNDRPHTISSDEHGSRKGQPSANRLPHVPANVFFAAAYEKGHHQRPALSVHTFQPQDGCQSQPCSPCGGPSVPNSASVSDGVQRTAQPIHARPPLPQRGSSLERPAVPAVPGKPNQRRIDAKVRNLEERMMQPTYVNMNELANMAASKAQEMQFPPPPAAVNQNGHHEKNETGEKESSASESSLESSSGYGSQSGISGATPTPEYDNGHQDDVYGTKNCSPFYSDVSAFRLDPRSRHSIAPSGYCTIKSGTLSRRGSIQSVKPAPPVRRTSSTLSTARTNPADLPPPPAFLLDASTEPKRNSAAFMSSFADQLKSATAQRIYATPEHRRSLNAIYAQGAAKPDEKEKPTPNAKSAISVAETVRTLTEMNHQPASPVSMRRASRSTSADRRPSEGGLIASLSARIASNQSPRNARKLDTLVGGKQVPRANRVRQWMASRTMSDPNACRASLMDQIKKGTRLRPTGIRPSGLDAGPV